MMELTPLDVRKKKGDFRRALRGYDPGVVDDFLDLVADRMETLVRDAAGVNERIARLEQQVADYRDREKALTEALVTAQEMREEIRSQSNREVDLLRRQAEAEAESIRGEAVRAREREEGALLALRSKQLQFLASYRTFLEQELSDLAAHARALEMQAGRVGATTPSRPPASKPAAKLPPAESRPASAPAPEAAGAEPQPDPESSPAPEAARPAVPAAIAPAVAPSLPPRPAPEPEPAPVPGGGEGGEEDIDAHVGAALAEWTTEFDDLLRGGTEREPEVEAELILSDDDVVAEEPELLLGDAGITSSAEPPAEPALPSDPDPEPEPRYDEKAFKREVSAAFSDTDAPDDDLLDLDSFDSLRGGVDPALGESIVGPPPVIPPDELTINPVFLERAKSSEPEGVSGEGERREPSPRQDMFSSMFEDDG